MTRYLLDTTPLSAYMVGKRPAVELIDQLLSDNHVIRASIVSIGEVFEYILGFGEARFRDLQMQKNLHSVAREPVTESIAMRYAAIRRQMRPPYGSGLIGDLDTLIAATALNGQFTLITTDSDFLRVPELTLVRLDRKTLEPISD